MIRFFIFLSSLLPLMALAHGEEKAGPSGGHIRMPGAFHTELTIDKEQGAHIFLLDINFANPTVKDSKIEMKWSEGKKEISFKCAVMGGNHFHCIPDKKYPAKSGALRVTATRENAPGQEVIYKLPLPPFKSEPLPEATHRH